MIKHSHLLAPALIMALTTVIFPTVLLAGGNAALATKLVREADAIRLPQRDFQVEVTITNKGRRTQDEVRKYRVFSKGPEDTVVQTTFPPTERGQILLMKGRDLWAFLPTISQPVRLSLAQRLTGQVANGDLARANFAGDYTPRLLRDETIDDNVYHVLELRAVNRSITYHRVMYWVAKDDARPYKAAFYSASGRLLKTCRYTDFKAAAGKHRPTRLIIEDALHPGEQSILEYRNFSLRPLPDKLFNKDYLKKLQ